MIASIAKGVAAAAGAKSGAARAMSTIRYAEFGHPLNVLKCVCSCVVCGYTQSFEP